MSKDLFQSYKITLVGSSKCGKSNLMKGFTKNKFIEEYKKTIIDSDSAVITVGEYVVQLEIWDTQGDLKAEKGDVCYPETNFFVICFSLVDPTSLVEVEKHWAKEIAKFNKKNKSKIPFILCGLKLDVREEPSVIRDLKKKNLDPILKNKGAMVSKKIKSKKYFEVSAKKMRGVKQMFKYIAHQLVNDTLKAESKNKKKSLLSLFSSVNPSNTLGMEISGMLPVDFDDED